MPQECSLGNLKHMLCERCRPSTVVNFIDKGQTSLVEIYKFFIKEKGVFNLALKQCQTCMETPRELSFSYLCIRCSQLHVDQNPEHKIIFSSPTPLKYSEIVEIVLQQTSE